MASPQHFQLDKSIFNASLYSRVNAFWFQGLPEGATAANKTNLKRWFGAGASEDEKKAFDEECRTKFEPALKTLSRSNLALPLFTSYNDEILQADTLVAPLIAEVTKAQSETGKNGVETLLALTLLLDQMTRNIYRDPAGMKDVFTHYDRLSFALVYATRSLSPPLYQDDSLRNRPVMLFWLQLPFMHSEHLPSHELIVKEMEELEVIIAKAGDQEAADYLANQLRYEGRHKVILEKFGRYPHRNECLGRKSIGEEEGWMRDGDSFGVKQSKDEKSDGKSEL